MKFLFPLTFYVLYVYLHSSMDRFEAVVASGNSSVVAIYIPVWIDLKLDVRIPYLLNKSYLHSSMDRFEVTRLMLQKLILKIYIPVWIDLKKQFQKCV